MTSATILPSIGPPPPEFRRPIVPEELRPKLVSERDVAPAPESAPPQPKQIVDPNSAGDALLATAVGQNTDNEASPSAQSNSAKSAAASNNLGGASAVALQVQEASKSETTKKVSEQKLQGELSDEEKATVKRLTERDREVRAHENAHATVGGGYTGSPSFEFSRGPDGVQYAVGGHVEIDVSPIPNDPEATIAKMEVVRSAALAPARPSGQDRAVAASAEAAMREAQAELRAQKQEEFEEARGASDETSTRGLSAALAQQAEQNTADNGSGLVGQASITSPFAGINLLV
jgi:hypothetical protein